MPRRRRADRRCRLPAPIIGSRRRWDLCESRSGSDARMILPSGPPVYRRLGPQPIATYAVRPLHRLVDAIMTAPPTRSGSGAHGGPPREERSEDGNAAARVPARERVVDASQLLGRQHERGGCGILADVRRAGGLGYTRNTWSRRPAIASPTISSTRPLPYISAVSTWVRPASSPARKAATAAARPSCSMFQVPWPTTGTASPVRPKARRVTPAPSPAREGT